MFDVCVWSTKRKAKALRVGRYSVVGTFLYWCSVMFCSLQNVIWSHNHSDVPVNPPEPLYIPSGSAAPTSTLNISRRCTSCSLSVSTLYVWVSVWSHWLPDHLDIYKCRTTCVRNSELLSRLEIAIFKYKVTDFVTWCLVLTTLIYWKLNV